MRQKRNEQFFLVTSKKIKTNINNELKQTPKMIQNKYRNESKQTSKINQNKHQKWIKTNIEN